MKRLLWFSVFLIVQLFVIGGMHIRGQAIADKSSWAAPTAMTIRKVGAVSTAQYSPVDLNDVDCTPFTYRLVNSSNMKTGCFVPTAFGMFDLDTQTTIFNGTDEGIPLSPSSTNQVLVPWPKALNLLTLDSAVTGGTYVNMYKNPLNSMRDERNTLGQLTAKKMTMPPEQPLFDEAGRRLIVNSQTISFSDGGSWMVAETVYGVFVRVNLATLKVQAFAKAFNRLGSSTPLDAQVAISEDGQFIAIQNDYAESFRVYDLADCSSGSAANPCPSHEYWNFLGQQLSGTHTIKHIRFVNDGLLSFEALPSSGYDGGTYELAPTSSITSLTDYMGLGDSYTSGEGAYDYLPGTDTDKNMCHVSSGSYPLRITRDLFTQVGGHSVACSGARIDDIVSSKVDYRGQAKDAPSWQELQQSATFLDSIQSNFIPGYQAQHRFVRQYQPRVITVSIGGNDIGFGNMLQNCVLPHISRHNSDSVCYNTYEDRIEVTQLIDRTVPRWVALYKQLHSESPESQLYAIGYPQISVDTGMCGLNVHLSKSELEFSQEVIAYLNGAIQQAASTAGVPYIDISQALTGHRLCEASSQNIAVNGLTAGSDAGFAGINLLGKESYHPTAFGYELIEQSILRQTDNLSRMRVEPIIQSNDAPTLLNAPKTGRAINMLVPLSGIVHGSLTAGDTAAIYLSGLEAGIVPGKTYTIRLDGVNGLTLASIASSETGMITGQVVMSSTMSEGPHTIDITGPSQTGQILDITQPFYITSQANASLTITKVSTKTSY